MAKAEKIVGIDCFADAEVWAAEILRVRFDEIVNLREAALQSEDIEGVHAMRVATRRLRSALRDFMPLLRKRPLKKVRRDLKELADALGEARDEDVAIATLAKLEKKAKSATVKDGISRLIEERRSRREQIDLTEALAAPAIEALHEKFASAIVKAVRKKNKEKAVILKEAGRAAAAANLQSFCDLSESLYKPFKVERLHELRIAAKRLRYALELFTVCWGEQIAPFAGQIAKMQTFLGEMHDADIWIEDSGKRLRDEKNSQTRAADIWLLSEFTRERTKNYCEALKLWSKWEKDGFVEKMQSIISQ